MQRPRPFVQSWAAAAMTHEQHIDVLKHKWQDHISKEIG